MNQWLAQITTWLVKLVTDLFTNLVDWLHDGFVSFLDLVMGAVASGVASISPPSFLTNGVGLSGLLGGLPPFAAYLAGQTRIVEALAIIGAGVSFNLLRKLFTLGQW